MLVRSDTSGLGHLFLLVAELCAWLVGFVAFLATGGTITILPWGKQTK